MRRALDTIGSIFVRVLPLIIGYIAYKAAGHDVNKASNPALQNITSVLQWAVGLIAGIAVYTLISELTLRRLPTQISAELSVAAQNISALENQIADLRDVAREQSRIFSDVQGLEIVYEFDDALRKARNLMSSAQARVSAMWTLLPYDEPLRTYFIETLASCPFTKRVIAIETIDRAALLDHIETSWEHLVSQRYEIFLIRQCNYEAMVIDGEQGALFFNSVRGFGSCYLSINTVEFGRVVEGLIEGLVTAGVRLAVSREEQFDLDRVSAWIDNQFS